MKISMLVIGSLIVAGCATAPSGPPLPTSATFERAKIDQVANAFAAGCANIGARIITQSANMIECAKPMGDSFKETAYKVMATENYASNPDFHYQFTLTQSIDGIDVNANSNEWIEHQNAFGKTTRNFITNVDAARILNQIHDGYVKQRTASR